MPVKHDESDCANALLKGKDGRDGGDQIRELRKNVINGKGADEEFGKGHNKRGSIRKTTTRSKGSLFQVSQGS